MLTHINAQTHTPRHALTHVHIHRYTHTHTHIHTHTHAHTYVHAHTNTYLHTFSARNEDQKLVGCFKDKIFNRLYYTAVLLKIYEKFDQLK